MTDIVKVRIIQNEKVGKDIYYLRLELPFSYPASHPGMFINLYLNNASKLLPRPISIFDHKDNELHLVYAITGEGTRELTTYRRDALIRITTPLGNGFAIPAYVRESDPAENDLLLIGGGMGIAPLHYLASSVHKKYRESTLKPDIYAVLGYSDEPFLHDFFGKYCTEIQLCSEEENDDCWHGTVLTPLTECEYTQIKNWFSCGPGPMQKALAEYGLKHSISNLQVSLEERMGCGFGTCVGCSIETINSNDNTIIRKKVCKDGPVFYGNEVIWK